MLQSTRELPSSQGRVGWVWNALQNAVRDEMMGYWTWMVCSACLMCVCWCLSSFIVASLLWGACVFWNIKQTCFAAWVEMFCTIQWTCFAAWVGFFWQHSVDLLRSISWIVLQHSVDLLCSMCWNALQHSVDMLCNRQWICVDRILSYIYIYRLK